MLRWRVVVALLIAMLLVVVARAVVMFRCVHDRVLIPCLHSYRGLTFMLITDPRNQYSIHLTRAVLGDFVVVVFVVVVFEGRLIE